MQYPRHTINQQDLYNDISFLFFLPFFHFGMCAGISAPSKRYMYFSPFFLFLLWNVYGCKNPHTSFLHPYTFQCGNRKKGERYMYFWDIPAPSPAHVHIPKWKIGKNVREYPLEYYPHCLTIRWARISFLGCITPSLYIFFCPRANAQKWLSKNALISLRSCISPYKKGKRWKEIMPYTYIFFLYKKLLYILNNSWPFLFTKREKKITMTSLLF